MKTRISIAIALAAAIASPLLTRGQDDPEQADFPKITAQPTDQGAWEGAGTTFSVQATNGNISYQWRRDGAVLEGQTNSDLVIESVAVSDVGLYSCDVIKHGGEAVPTRSASLNVITMTLGGGPITVFGTPIVSSGSKGSTCPGPYVGYVNFRKTPAEGWGWTPSSGTTVHTATDNNRTNTKVEYVGNHGDNGCNQTTVTVPDPTMSPKYRFTIYFTNNVPTNAYPLTLDGFDP
jgi:hypothetical protein